jgi:hypothetical protein
MCDALDVSAVVEPSLLGCTARHGQTGNCSGASSALRTHARATGAWLLLIGALAVTATADAATVRYDGRAVDPESGRLLYTERHLLRDAQGEPLERLVSYLCPNGTVFARKRVDYAPSPVAPSFQLDDGRDGYREGVRRTGARIDAFVRQRTGAAEERGTLPAGPRLVADAGFDEYVRRNWSALVAGHTLPVDFAVPASRRAYTFKLRKLASPTIDGVPAHLFRLKIGGLLGLVAPQIDVAYARESKRLLRFEGVTNLRDYDGDQWTARISFADRAAEPVDDSLWAKALAAPLRSCSARK